MRAFATKIVTSMSKVLIRSYFSREYNQIQLISGSCGLAAIACRRKYAKRYY